MVKFFEQINIKQIKIYQRRMASSGNVRLVNRQGDAAPTQPATSPKNISRRHHKTLAVGVNVVRITQKEQLCLTRRARKPISNPVNSKNSTSVVRVGSITTRTPTRGGSGGSCLAYPPPLTSCIFLRVCSASPPLGHWITAEEGSALPPSVLISSYSSYLIVSVSCLTSEWVATLWSLIIYLLL